jgi:membrane protease YdiL (CAAX protease family)
MIAKKTSSGRSSNKSTKRSKRSSKKSSKRKSSKILTLGDLLSQDKNFYDLTKKEKIQFCENQSYFSCNSKHTACIKVGSLFTGKKCVYDHKLEEYLMESIKHECDFGCKCMTEERPYTANYRSRQFCSKVPLVLTKGIAQHSDYSFLISPLSIFTGIPRFITKIKDDFKMKDKKKQLIKYGKIVGAGTLFGIMMFIIGQTVTNFCAYNTRNVTQFKYNPYYAVYKMRVSKDIKFVNFFSTFIRNVPKNTSNALNYAINELSNNIKRVTNKPKKEWLYGLVAGVGGAQEELFFRNVLLKYIEVIKPILFKFINKFNFSKKVTEKSVHNIYLLFAALISGVLFGLMHIDGRFINNCRVIVTAVAGILFTYLKDNTSLSVSWMTHFMHNLIV